MYSLGPVKWDEANKDAVHYSNRHFDFWLSAFMIRIKSTDTIEDLIERWQASSEDSVFTLELHRRGCILDPKDDSWTCRFK
jgi:hypothetical protein